MYAQSQKVNKSKIYLDELEFELFKDELMRKEINKNNQLVHDYVVTNLSDTDDNKTYKQRNIHFRKQQSRT